MFSYPLVLTYDLGAPMGRNSKDQNSLETVFFDCHLSPVGSSLVLTFSIAAYPVWLYRDGSSWVEPALS